MPKKAPIFIPTVEQVRAMFNFDAATGVFTRRVATRNGAAGSLVGWSRDGYFALTIGRRKYAAHRIAWLYVNGVWPKGEIDHINRDRSDNRMCNLREVAPHENLQNIPVYRSNTSGHKGVDRKADGAWRARIRVNGRRVHLGCFRTIEEAADAYKVAQAKFHPCAPIECSNPRHYA